MNYVNIELDTTGPELEIFAPAYTTRSAMTPVIIQSNEPVSSFQDVYILDSGGNRHAFTFAHKGNTLEGELYLSGFTIGSATLFVQLKDEVDNLSKVYSHSFKVMQSELLKSVMSLKPMATEVEVQSMRNQLFVADSKKSISLLSQQCKMNVMTMQNEIEVGNQ